MVVLRCRRFLLLLMVAVALSGCRTADPEALSNVLGYRLRRAFPPLLLFSTPSPTATLTGHVWDEAGRPVADAVALVATVRGQVISTRTDAAGRFRLEGIPPGRYTPMAGAWGFEAVNGAPVQLAAGQPLSVDFTLPVRRPAVLRPTDPAVGEPVLERSQFPEPMAATRIPFSFTLDGARIDNAHLYLPSSPSFPSSPSSRTSPLPLVVLYPSHPLNWNAVSVALTREGNPVLALGPHVSAGLDIDLHARQARAAVELWQAGRLAPWLPPDDRWLGLAGSFSSLILFRMLPDLARPPQALISVGGISDAFLGVQALYDTELSIPPPYDMAVAALGRPDRDPAFFFNLSPVFFAEHLPPTLVIHTYNDEVIPYNQAEALAAALDAAGVPHELLLYEDTTHYLDAYRPTPATYLVYGRVLDYIRAAQ
ncbi:MAG: carboxypeptidase regulatory-like domain-containing protein [Caldilineales bacterium]|nr:carboxypeptidase regulatory-like domain-containing protein [Caldilineales bacterium]MDW8317674.1 carboxypeptidase regulatory-like domain-containing protein [Anaerolineae bacterium]